MTSGSLMHLNSFIEIGGFDEKMFIAHLDIDLGIKIHEINKSIIVIHDSILNNILVIQNLKKYYGKLFIHLMLILLEHTYLFRNKSI